MARRKQPRVPRFIAGDDPFVGGTLTYEMTDEEKDKQEMFVGASLAPNEDMADRLRAVEGMMLNREVYNPSASKRFKRPGTWVMLLRVPPVGLPIRDKSIHATKVMSRGLMFWARHDEGTDEFGFNAKGLYKVVTTTPWGEVHLWPYEYSVMDPVAITKMYQAGELIFHPMTKRPTFTDELFYVMSRGVPVEEAMPMVLGGMVGPIGWFEPSPELKKAIAATFL
jgi:hypothetical protein